MTEQQIDRIAAAMQYAVWALALIGAGTVIGWVW